VGTRRRSAGTAAVVSRPRFRTPRTEPRGAQAVKQRSGRSSAGANSVFTFGAWRTRARPRCRAVTDARARPQATSPSFCSGCLRLGCSCTSAALPRRRAPATLLERACAAVIDVAPLTGSAVRSV
jgi:hypothetical protein